MKLCKRRANPIGAPGHAYGDGPKVCHPNLWFLVVFCQNWESPKVSHKRVRAIDARNSQLENGSNAAKTSVRAPGLSADEREHPFV